MVIFKMFIIRHCCINLQIEIETHPKIKLNHKMGHSETFNSARNFAVMVRIRGPVSISLSLYNLNHAQSINHDHSPCNFIFQDPKGMKMRNHAFHHYRFLDLFIIYQFFIFLIQSFGFYEFMVIGFCFVLLGMCSSGETTLSASGVLVPDKFCDAEVARGLYGGEFEDRVLVVTVASVVEPFLSPQHRENVPQVGTWCSQFMDSVID